MVRQTYFSFPRHGETTLSPNGQHFKSNGGGLNLVSSASSDLINNTMVFCGHGSIFFVAPDDLVYWVQASFHYSLDLCTLAVDHWGMRYISLMSLEAMLKTGMMRANVYKVFTKRKQDIRGRDINKNFPLNNSMRQNFFKTLVDVRGDRLMGEIINDVDDAPLWFVEYRLGQMFS